MNFCCSHFFSPVTMLALLHLCDFTGHQDVDPVGRTNLQVLMIKCSENQDETAALAQQDSPPAGINKDSSKLLAQLWWSIVCGPTAYSDIMEEISVLMFMVRGVLGKLSLPSREMSHCKFPILPNVVHMSIKL